MKLGLYALIATMAFYTFTAMASWKEAEERRTTEITVLVEARLEKWKPSKKNLEKPAKSIMASDVDIEGVWLAHRGLDHTSLHISKTNANLSINFYTSGCLSRWQLNRTGLFTNGVLTLNRPVDEYYPLTYMTLYAIQIEGIDYLVSSAAVGKLQEILQRNLKVERKTEIQELYLFKKQKLHNAK